MPLSSLAAVVLRLVAINFLLQVMVLMLPRLKPLHVEVPGGTLTGSLVAVVVICALLVIGLFTWFQALPIARFITRGIPEGVTLGNLSLGDCYAIGFAGMGVYFTIQYLAPVLTWAHYLFKMAASQSGSAWKDEVDVYQVVQVVLPFVGGVVLLHNGGSWARKLGSSRQGAAEQSGVERSD